MATDQQSQASPELNSVNENQQSSAGAYSYVSNAVYNGFSYFKPYLPATGALEDDGTPHDINNNQIQNPNNTQTNNNNNNNNPQKNTQHTIQPNQNTPNTQIRNGMNCESKTNTPSNANKANDANDNEFKLQNGSPTTPAPIPPSITCIPAYEEWLKDSKDSDNNESYIDVKPIIEQVAKDGGIPVEWAKKIGQPIASTVKLRSRTYKQDQVKQESDDTIFKLAHVQCFKTEQANITNIAIHPCSFYYQNINPNDRNLFCVLVHLQVKSLKVSYITTHILTDISSFNENGSPMTGDSAFDKLFDSILNHPDDEYRNNRMKIVPRIVQGPYPVKRVVENRPVLLGNKVPLKYFRGFNYFEIDAKVDDTMVAASIIRLCHRFTKRLVVDMAWTIQGEELDELPERVLCGNTICNMDFSKLKDINWQLQKMNNPDGENNRYNMQDYGLNLGTFAPHSEQTPSASESASSLPAMNSYDNERGNTPRSQSNKSLKNKNKNKNKKKKKHKSSKSSLY